MRPASVILTVVSAFIVSALVAGGPAHAGAQGQATFPAQQRPPGDPALIARGETLYEITCRSCHGADLRGGDLGGPNLLRSPLVLNDRQGELMGPVIQNGVSNPGETPMPPQPLSDDDVRAVAEYIHSIVATARPQGAPPAGAEVELDILVGDRAAGQAYFTARCAGCHSPTGDLEGLATRVPDPKELQNTWVRGSARGAPRPPVTVTVILSSEERPEGRLTRQVVGRLERLDDFFVALVQADGRRRSFTRTRGVPAVEVFDPLAAHTDLLPVYTDTDIHNVTAYLSTLK